MQHRPLALAALALAASIPFAAHAEGTFVIKTATLAPEGSSWMKVVNAWDKEMQALSGGRLKFKVYAGGVLGDEKDVVRKLRVGQVQAAAFSGVGLGQILSDIRVLEMPMAFRSYAEVDAAQAALRPYFVEKFAAAGYVLASQSEAGFVHIFAKKPVRTRADLKGIKMWAWEGDPVAAESFKQYDVVPTPVPLPDVLTSLQTGLLDGAYAPPLVAGALQWHTKTKYITRDYFAYAVGAFLVQKAFFDSMPADLQKILLDTSAKYGAQLTAVSRRDNERSLSVFQKQGLELVDFEPAEKAQLEATAARVRESLTGTLFPKELLDRMMKVVAETRAGAKP